MAFRKFFSEALFVVFLLYFSSYFLCFSHEIPFALAFILMSHIAAAQTPQPPEIAARAYLLVDVTANQILAAKEMDAPVEPAS